MDHLSILENAYGVTFDTNLYGSGHINKTYVSTESPASSYSRSTPPFFPTRWV